MTNKTPIAPLMLSAISEVLERNPKKWANTLHAQLMDLEIDCRGEVGELFLAKGLRSIGRVVDVDRTTSSSDKHWDLEVDGGSVRIEVKTATMGKGETFQHEGINRKRDWNVLALVDISPDSVYLTLAPKGTLPFRVPNDTYTSTKRKMHLRDGAGIFKWDLKLSDVESRRVLALEDLAREWDVLFQRLENTL